MYARSAAVLSRPSRHSARTGVCLALAGPKEQTWRAIAPGLAGLGGPDQHPSGRLLGGHRNLTAIVQDMAANEFSIALSILPVPDGHVMDGTGFSLLPFFSLVSFPLLPQHPMD